MHTVQAPRRKTSIFTKAVIGVGVIFGLFVVLGVAGMIFFPVNYYEEGMDAYNKGKYEKAYAKLDKVKPGDKDYKDAVAKMREIKPVVDSLQKIKQDEALAKKNKATNAAAALTDVADHSEDGEMDLKTRVENTIKSIDGGDDLTKNEMTSATEFQISAALYGAYALIIDEGNSSTDAAVLKLTKQLEKKVKASQLKNFPKLRKAYYQFIKNTLWEHDVDVHLSGSGNTTVKFTGAYFGRTKTLRQLRKPCLRC